MQGMDGADAGDPGDDMPQNRQLVLSPKDEKAESALRVKCDTAGVDYEPPCAGEGKDEKRKRRHRLSQKCRRMGVSGEDRDKDRCKAKARRAHQMV